MLFKLNKRPQNFIILSSVVILTFIAIFLTGKTQFNKIAPNYSKPITFTKPEGNKGPLEVTSLKPVADSTGFGTAGRMFVQNRFYQLLEANLPQPPRGSFYEGWLQRPGTQADFIYMGKLKKSEKNYYLSYNQQQNPSQYSQVIVTSEKIDDKKPETQLLKGTF